MAIVVVGDIDVDQMEAKIKQQFAHVPLRPHGHIVQSFPVPDTKGISIAKATDKEATFTLIQMIYKQPRFIEKTIADYRKELAIDMFNEMMNARLAEIRQQPDAPFTFAGAEAAQPGDLQVEHDDRRAGRERVEQRP